MNILLPDSWLREYLDTSATPKQIKDCLSLCGPSVERVEKKGNDYIYDVEITSNRVDMASVLGVAREANSILPRFGIPAALKQLELNEPSKPEFHLPMNITDPQKNCNRIMGIVMEVNPMEQAPEYMKDRIEKSGVRSLNNLVDVTNYVMLEVGHPCHVFDYDRIKTHTFSLRRAKNNEPIKTLDGKTYLLNEEDVIIDDGTGRIIDLPGIMGTENSVVTRDTRRIIFFIESNNPVLIRKTSMRYAIRTMAATINEKHPDPELVKTAMLRGIELYQKFAGGKVAGELIDIYHGKTIPKKISVSDSFINERLGVKLSKSEIINILESLSFEIDDKDTSEVSKGLLRGGGIRVTPPTFRQFDVTIPEDIVEEIARIYGYHNLPSRLMEGQIPVSYKSNIHLDLEEKIKTVLKYWGYTEVYHYSFISEELIKKTGLPVSAHLKVANPLTHEIEYMRNSLFPSMLNTIIQNQDKNDSLKLFELAKVYIRANSNLPSELSMLLIISQEDFYTIKGLVESLLSELGIAKYDIKPNTLTLLHPNISVEFKVGNSIVGRAGKLHPQLSSQINLKGDFFAAYLSLAEIEKRIKPSKIYQPIPQYPPVIEDLTFILPVGVKIGHVLETAARVNLVSKAELTDRFKNQITLKITYQDKTKNLDSEKVKSIRDTIISLCKNRFNLRLKSAN